MRTFLFYDLETSGLNPCFDQVLQAAAIRTDQDLQELERISFLVRLSPDVIPHPAALLTHQLTPERCAQEGISEWQAIQTLHQWLNTPGTQSLGYNTLSFDDIFLRFSFYRHLLPPYQHQYAADCSRLDLFPMTILYWLFNPEVLQWPVREGKTSLKLEALNLANQWFEGNAHDAMVDVEVTLALARVLKKSPAMWEYCLGFFDKNIDKQRSLKLPANSLADGKTYRHGLVIESGLGEKNSFLAPVLLLGEHKFFANQVPLLRLDNPDLMSITSEDIPGLRVIRKKWGETGLLLPPQARYLQKLTSERQQLMMQNLEWLHRHPELLLEIKNYHCQYRYPKVEQLDAQSSLYDGGFWTDSEKTQCAKFQTLPNNQYSAWLDRQTNPVLYELGLRLLGRHKPEVLSAAQSLQFQQYLQRIWRADLATTVDYRGIKRYSRSQALADIDSFTAPNQADPHKLALLASLTALFTQY